MALIISKWRGNIDYISQLVPLKQVNPSIYQLNNGFQVISQQELILKFYFFPLFNFSSSVLLCLLIRIKLSLIKYQFDHKFCYASFKFFKFFINMPYTHSHFNSSYFWLYCLTSVIFTPHFPVLRDMSYGQCFIPTFYPGLPWPLLRKIRYLLLSTQIIFWYFKCWKLFSYL